MTFVATLFANNAYGADLTYTGYTGKFKVTGDLLELAQDDYNEIEFTLIYKYDEKEYLIGFEIIQLQGTDNIVDLTKLQPDAVSARFGVKSFDEIAKKRGCILRGGVLDTRRAAKMILSEFHFQKNNHNKPLLISVHNLYLFLLNLIQ